MLVRVLRSFTAYPDPDGTRRDFRAGETAQVPDGFGRLLIQKGLAERVREKKSAEIPVPDADPAPLDK